MNYRGISLEAYSQYIIELKDQGHKFLTATKFLEFKSDVFWRHDIDLSIDASVKLAKLEKALEVCTTYYVDLNTYFYNALSISNIEKINFIANQGHEVGVILTPDFLNTTSMMNSTIKFLNIQTYFSIFWDPNQKALHFTVLIVPRRNSRVHIMVA